MRESRRVFPFVTGRDCVFLAIQIVLKVWVQGNVPSSSHWDAQRTLSRNWSDMFVDPCLVWVSKTWTPQGCQNKATREGNWWYGNSLRPI